MRSGSLKSTVSLVLVVGFVSTGSAPAWALRPTAKKEGNKSGLEELTVALASGNPEEVGRTAVRLASAAGIVPSRPLPLPAAAGPSSGFRTGLEEGFRQDVIRVETPTLLGKIPVPFSQGQDLSLMQRMARVANLEFYQRLLGIQQSFPEIDSVILYPPGFNSYPREPNSVLPDPINPFRLSRGGYALAFIMVSALQDLEDQFQEEIRRTQILEIGTARYETEGHSGQALLVGLIAALPAAGLEEKAVVVSAASLQPRERKTLSQRAGHAVSVAFSEGRAFTLTNIGMELLPRQIEQFVNQWVAARALRELEPSLPAEKKQAEADLAGAVGLIKRVLSYLNQKLIEPFMDEETGLVDVTSMSEEDAQRFEDLLQRTRYALILEPALPNREETLYAQQAMGFPPKIHYSYGSASPVLYEEGQPGTDFYRSVVAMAGTYPYEISEPAVAPQTIYLSVAHLKRLAQLIKEAPAQEKKILKTLAQYLVHLDDQLMLQAGSYPNPSGKRGSITSTVPATFYADLVDLEKQVASLWQKEMNAQYQRRLTQVEKARERQLNQTILEFANIRLGKHVVASGIPEESVAAAKAVLAAAKEGGQMAGFRVLAAADDLVVQVNHRHGPQSPFSGRLMVEAGTAALQAAARKKILKESGQRLLASNYADRSRGLGIRRGVLPMTERVADPILVVHAVNGGAGTFNRAIWRALINLDTHPSARIAGDTFRAVVEAIDDVRQGKKDRARYTFAPGQMKELLALIGDHSEYMITEVYAETGRFTQSNPGEPVVKVIVEPVDAVGFTEAPANPTMVVRIQSGSEALGVFTDAIANPWAAPGGSNDAYHLTTIPVTWEQANQTPQRGYINLVAYEYTSYGDGRVPLDRDIIDPFNPVARPDAGLLAKLWGHKTPELQVTFQLAQERAHRIANFLMGHGEMDPFLTARGAEALSERTGQLVEGYWRPLPKTELSLAEGGEEDPVVAIANAASNGRTFSIIKADAGGEGAHLVPPAYFSLAAEATRDIMLEDGLIRSGEHFAVGDDNEVLTVHRRGMDSHDIHMTNYRIFWRMVYLAANYELLKGQVKARGQQGVAEQVRKIFPAKIYQAGQDLVSEAVRGKPVPQLAEVDDRSVRRMAELLRRVGRENQAEALEYGYQIYKAGQGTVVASVNPFSGTITGQGPGFSEYPLPAKGPVRLAGFFTDKDGPAAFNVPTVWVLETALARGMIRKRGGAIAEIYDTKAQKHIFLDVETQMDIIRGLAANPDRYNFKRVVSKRKAGWDPARWEEYVGDQWFISLSTEKLSVITGGEYRGKDDSVLVASADEDEDFGQLYFEFDARYSYFTQGDGFGSHDTTIRPELLPTAIATMQSRGVKSAFLIDVNEDDQMTFTEVYTDPAFRARRREGEEITRLLWDANGSEFTPVGVGWRRVERSYPLAKMIVAITGVDWDLLADTTTDTTAVSVVEILKKSPFAVRAHVDVAQSVAQGELVELFPSINQQTTARVARAAADARNPKRILLHESFFGQGPEGAIAIQRTLGEMGFASLDEAARESAVKLLVAGPSEFGFSQMIKVINSLSRGGVQLEPEWFTIVSGISDPVDAAIGKSAWVNGTVPTDAGVTRPRFGDQVVKVAVDEPSGGERVSAAAAFYRGLEAVAATHAAGLEESWVKAVEGAVSTYQGLLSAPAVQGILGERLAQVPTLAQVHRSLAAGSLAGVWSELVAAQQALASLEIPTYPKENLAKHLREAVEKLPGPTGVKRVWIFVEKEGTVERRVRELVTRTLPWAESQFIPIGGGSFQVAPKQAQADVAILMTDPPAGDLESSGRFALMTFLQKLRVPVIPAGKPVQYDQLEQQLLALNQRVPAAGLEEAAVLERPAVVQSARAALFTEIREGLGSFTPSAVELEEAHIFDPQNADVGRVVAALIGPDPVVIIARDAEHEQELLDSGFGGLGRMLLRLDLYGSIEEARADAAKRLPSFSPRFYRAQDRQNLPAWLGGILERYNVPESLISVERAERMVRSLEVLRAA